MLELIAPAFFLWLICGNSEQSKSSERRIERRTEKVKPIKQTTISPPPSGRHHPNPPAEESIADRIGYEEGFVDHGNWDRGDIDGGSW